MLWKTKKTEEDFMRAIRDVRRSKPKLKGRPRKGQLASGLIKVTGYFSPNEADALKQLAEAEGCSTSETLRALLRLYVAVAVDGDEAE